MVWQRTVVSLTVMGHSGETITMTQDEAPIFYHAAQKSPLSLRPREPAQ